MIPILYRVTAQQGQTPGIEYGRLVYYKGVDVLVRAMARLEALWVVVATLVLTARRQAGR